MRLGLIGPGRHGSRYLQEQNGGRYFTRVLSRAPRTDLPEWVKGTIDPEEFFAPGLDGVVIATPTETHAEFVMDALMRGLDVLCEKPLCASPEYADRIVTAAECFGRRLLVAHTDLFHSTWRPKNEAPVSAMAVFGGAGALKEWEPHAVAALTALHPGAILYAPRVKSVGNEHQWKIQAIHEDGGKSEIIAIVTKNHPVRLRRVGARYKDGSVFVFDGTKPSDPSPIRNMLDVFCSNAEDRRFSYDFTRAVYRVLLTDPD